MKRTLGAWLMCLLGLSCVEAQATDISERVKPCEVCHGSQGRAGPDGYYPRLAGKPTGYLHNQMQNFSHGRRRYPMMRRMMEPLSPQYQQEMADYFANLQVPYPPAASQRTTNTVTQMARGKQLATVGDLSLKLPACSACHGDNLMGSAPHVPGLLGLPAAYLGAQLSAWSLGERATVAPDCMGEIAKQLSVSDAAAVTAWLAAQDIPTSKAALTSKRTTTPVHLRCGSAPQLQGAMQ